MPKVFINPGHCPGWDPGAVNRMYNITEADIVKDIGELAAGYLRDAGYEVQVLQSDNLCGENPKLPNICRTANNWQANVFVSIHCNACNGIAQGTEVLVYSHWSQADKLANYIQRQIVDSLGTIDRGVKEATWPAVLRETNMPAVLVETAFIDSPADANRLMKRKDDFARAIARGVTDYFSKSGEN